MNSFLNEEQQEHVKELNTIPRHKKCACGWELKKDCRHDSICESYIKKRKKK